MFDTVLAIALALVLVGAMLVWLPALQSVETHSYGSKRRNNVEEMPDLVDDDTSPRLTGKVA